MLMIVIVCICVKLTRFAGEIDYYYEMSEKLQEDYSLRQTLAMRRLEEALSCQQRER